MNTYSICIIDDKIPAKEFPAWDDTKILDENSFRSLLSLESDKWKESELRDLIQEVLKRDIQYSLTGFTSHSFFLNHAEENIYSPDIVIFDWDVGEGVDSSRTNLLEILNSKYCLVAIYTAADMQDEVTNVIAGEEFKDHANSRLFLMKKGDENSVEKLTADIEKRLEYFSFKLGQTLKKDTLQAIDNILVNIGKLSFDQFVGLFGTDGENGKKVISHIDFIDILTEKLKYELNIPSKVEMRFETQNINKINDPFLLRKIWHFRLYHNSKDSILRKGDIIREGDDKNKLFLVLSSDCHLNEFWKKSLGYLALVPLHRVTKDNYTFKARMKYLKANQIKDFRLSSLVNPNQIDFLTILPGIDVIDSEYADYALNPREIRTREIDLGKDSSAKRHLLIEDIPDFRKLISVSEPFMSALFQFITQNFSGFGLPDFSLELQDSITEKLQELKE